MYDTGFIGGLILELSLISGKSSLYKTFSRSKAKGFYNALVNCDSSGVPGGDMIRQRR